MTIETEVAALTTATTALATAVGLQQVIVTDAVANFVDVTGRVNSGLNQVDNTTDLNKPINTLTQTALDLKQVSLVSGVNISTINGFSILGGEPLVIERSATSISKIEYDNRATLRTLTPEIDDAVVVIHLGLFMWYATKEEPDDDETCFTTDTGQWLLVTPAWELIDAWDIYEQAVLDDWIEDEPLRFATYFNNQ